MKKSSGSTTAEVMVSLVICLLFIMLLVPWRQQSVKMSCSSRCKSNMSIFRAGLTQYQLDFGRQVYYPQKQGQGFITTLYEDGILVEPLSYLCSKTKDTNSDLELQNAPRLGDHQGAVSYAGRINSVQATYPGFFKISEETSTTPMISDDLPDTQFAAHNHQEQQTINVLFLDGHVDYIRYGFIDNLFNKNNTFDPKLFSVLRN